MDGWPGEKPSYGYSVNGEYHPFLVDSYGRLILSPLTEISTSGTVPVTTANQSTVICNPVSTLLLPVNPSRKGLVIFNPLDTCFINLADIADSTHYAYRLTRNCSLELPGWAGVVNGCKETTSSLIMVTEY